MVGNTVFYCQVNPNCNVYEILELTVRTDKEDYAVGIDSKSKQAYMYSPNMVGEYVFNTRGEALEALKIFRSKGEKDG